MSSVPARRVALVKKSFVFVDLQVLGEATAPPGTRRDPPSAIAWVAAVLVAILLICLR